jgi:hypothetical protein
VVNPLSLGIVEGDRDDMVTLLADLVLGQKSLRFSGTPEFCDAGHPRHTEQLQKARDTRPELRPALLSKCRFEWTGLVVVVSPATPGTLTAYS